MAEPWMSVLSKSRKKGGKEQINITILQPPRRGMELARSSMYTGAGANGKVEPGKAVALDSRTNPPSVYHEDEVVKQQGNQLQILPSPMTGMQTAKTEGQQAQMGQMQKQMGLPGFQYGGTATVAPSTPGQNAGAADMYKPYGASNNPGASAGSANMYVPQTQGPGQNVGAAGMYDPMSKSNNPGQFAGAAGMYSGTTPVQKQVQAQATAIPTLPAFTPTIPTATPMITMQGVKDTNVTSPATTPALPTVKAQTPYQAGAEEGYSAIRDLARGQSKTNEMARDRSLNYLDANAAANNAATAQTLRSQGWNEDDIAAYMATQTRSQGSQRSQTARDLAISEEQQAQTAQQQLATLGRSAYESDRSFDYNKAMDAANIAITSGDYASAGQALNDAFPGVNIDFTKVINKENANEFAAGMEDLQTAISVGLPWSTIVNSGRADAMAKTMGTDVATLQTMFEGLGTQANSFDAAMSSLTSSTVYRNATPEDQKMLEAAVKTGMVAGYGMKYNPETDKFEVDTSTQTAGEKDAILGTVQTWDPNATQVQVDAWRKANGDTAPATAEDWETFKATQSSAVNVLKYLSGDQNVELSTPDRTMLDTAITASLKPANQQTVEEKTALATIPTETLKQYTDALANKIKPAKEGTNMGITAAEVAYLYDTTKLGDDLRTDPPATSGRINKRFFDQNKMTLFRNDRGETYVIDDYDERTEDLVMYNPVTGKHVRVDDYESLRTGNYRNF